MTDILIRDIPDDVLAAVDAKAKRLGLSRSAYLRRSISRESRADSPVTEADLRRLASIAADLDDPDMMAGAWS